MIVLDEKHRIVQDSHNIILQFFEPRIRTKDNGEKEDYEYTNNLSYHISIDGALKRYIRNNINDCESIQGILEKLKELDNKIDSIKWK